MANEDLRDFLQTGGLASPDAVFTPFGGGVSSDVWRVDDGGRSFVVKRSVPKLRVQADWFSDPSRLRYEFLYLQAVGEFLPDAVPQLLSHDPDASFLAMEYLGDGFENWKSLLLEGSCRTRDAVRAGSILGTIHATTRKKPEILNRFDTLEFFTQLRIDAYLRATAARHPGPVGERIEAEANRLAGHAECLVHGDFSPKNMLTSDKRFVILDCETACHGDPAFDLAFLLNHLCLKALHHAPAEHGLGALISAAVGAYREADIVHAKEVESRTAILLPMLQLARVDGKSPVEYLADPTRERVREFALACIVTAEADLPSLLDAWFGFLALDPPRLPQSSKP